MTNRKNKKVLWYEGKWLQPYIQLIMWVMTVITDLAALAFLAMVVYRYGFFLSKAQGSTLEMVYRWIWVIFLLDTTLYLIMGRRLKEEGFKRSARVLSVFLYLTLIPILIPLPANVPVVNWVWEVLGGEYYRFILLSLFSFFYLSNSMIRLLGRRTNPSLILAISFLIIILIGTGLLMLPRCTLHGISWIDSLYIATSAVCVTGLTSVDVASTFTPMGFAVIILLIQVGGLGVMTLTSFFAMFFLGNTSLYNQLVVRDAISAKSLGSLLSVLLYILVFTLIIEAVGMLAIWWSVHGTMDMNVRQELAFSVFHSISAFCNAGFSTLPGNLGNPLLIKGHNAFYLFVSVLIIWGGIGFPILVNFKDIALHHLRNFWRYLHIRKRVPFSRYHPFNLNTRIVLVTTVILLVSGTLIILFFEWNNALSGMPVWDKLTHAFFNAVSPRTAGFTSIDLTTMGIQSILFYMVLMWIGGGAQSTAGGIKVNAFAVIVLNFVAVLRGTDRVEVYGRQLSFDSVRRANAAMVMSLGTIFLFVFLLTMLESELSVTTIVFECISAIGTVGSSLNASSRFSDMGKLLIVILMFVGRVGLITLLLGIVKQKKEAKYEYPKEDIIIN